MSKGWESKNVEEQQTVARPEPGAVKLGGGAGGAAADRQRRIQALELQRERVLNETTSSPHRRHALQEALATLKRDLQELGWMIKL